MQNGSFEQEDMVPESLVQVQVSDFQLGMPRHA